MSEAGWPTRAFTDEATHDRRADPLLVAKLKQLDERLELVYNQSRHQWALIRMADVKRNHPIFFGVMEYARMPLLIRVLDYPDGKPRDPGFWLLDWLHAADARNVDMNEYIQKKEAFEAAVEKKEEDRFVEKVKDDLKADKKYTYELSDALPREPKAYEQIAVDGFKDEASKE